MLEANNTRQPQTHTRQAFLKCRVVVAILRETPASLRSIDDLLALIDRVPAIDDHGGPLHERGLGAGEEEDGVCDFLRRAWPVHGRDGDCGLEDGHVGARHGGVDYAWADTVVQRAMSVCGFIVSFEGGCALRLTS